MDYENHWNNIYRNSKVETLGWFEKSSNSSVELIKKCNLSKQDPVLIAGAGATTLVDYLLKEGYCNIIANDISSTAFDKLKERLGGSSSRKIKWVVDDLTNPKELSKLPEIALWHDRAVLHFFLEKNQQETYFNLVRKLVRSKGYVIIAAFSLSGASRCSGLAVHRYNEEMLKNHLGKNFQLMNAFNHIYTMPSGETRKYIYTLFQRD